MTKLSQIISRLEQATGPDRAIDAAIFEAAAMVDEHHCKEWCRMNGRTDLTRDMYVRAWAHKFTLSMDAAVKLVPRGRWYIADSDTDSGGKPVAAVFTTEDMLKTGRIVRSVGATPAIALCIAALKVRSLPAINEIKAT